MEEKFYVTMSSDVTDQLMNVWLDKPSYLTILKREELVLTLNERIFEVECNNNFLEIKFTKRFNTWNDKTARLFAIDCVKHVLPIWHKTAPDSDYIEQLIENAKEILEDKLKTKNWNFIVQCAKEHIKAFNIVSRFFVRENPIYFAADVMNAAMYMLGRNAFSSAQLTAYNAFTATCHAHHPHNQANYSERQWQTEKLFQYLEEKI